MIMSVQENNIDLVQHKGPVRACEYCRPEEVLLGRACTWCLGNFFLATCLNCHGEGKVTAGSVWDGGRSQYTSVCGICGGKGIFPAREADYQRQQASMGNGHGYGNGNGNGVLRTMPQAVRPMVNLNINRDRSKG
jgi:hypothetical protein